MKLNKKIFLLLVGLASLSVAMLFVIALQVFVEDKATYIRESQLENAQLLAQHILLKSTTDDSSSSPDLFAFDPLKSENYRAKFLIDLEGNILGSSQKLDLQKTPNIRNLLPEEALNRLLDETMNEGSFEISTQGTESIISFVRIPQKQATIVLEASKKSAIRASIVFIIRVAFAILALVIIAVIISYFAANSLTKTLVELEKSMRAFGEGNLDAFCPLQGKDEIGLMAGYFNKMTEDIRMLFKSHTEKVKLEFEMETASELQSHFFPCAEFDRKEIEFRGFYKPSSHCGGDWWFYFTKDDCFVAFIGDVSGHGMKSALMTAASRAIFGLIEETFTDTSSAMSVLNRSFYSAANEEVNMSALLISVNLRTGLCQYTNASHDPALLWSKESLPELGSPIAVENGLHSYLLTEIHGQRLGVQRDLQFSKTEFIIPPSSLLMAYTDGVIELENNKGRRLSDNQILKWFSEIKNLDKQSSEQVRKYFLDKLSHFSENFQSLEDDLSFIVVKRTPVNLIQE